tara:strand:+ start:2410 stop:3285 length:876 start_codon:yes stop_codon:yes gene_type:complete
MSSKIPYTAATVSASPGFRIYPLEVSEIGIVTFTSDGSNQIRPTKFQCESYGYKFDESTGTCYGFKPSDKLANSIGKTTNNVKGQNNTLANGVENTSVIGQSNTLLNNTRGNVIIGNNHTVNENLTNGMVTGIKANVTTSGSLTMGGNQPTDNLAERQTIIVQYGCQTTGTANVSAGINNESGVRFVLPDNAICYFHADTIVVRTGGSGSGSVGDYASYVERGVLINKSGTTSIQRERDTIKTSGTITNWRILAAAGSGQTLALQCRGNTNQTLEWNMTVRITMIQTDVSL